MDFFKSQDVARRSTHKLLFLFACAVVCLVVLTNLLVYWGIYFSGASQFASFRARSESSVLMPYDLRTFLFVSAGVLLFILLGSAWRIRSLADGGEAVAAMMDGQLVVDAGDDVAKRRLLNVVEEMAIASGVPVPPVYLIPDRSINAFAAGHSPGDAVIGITHGAIENFNRDQLQGVIAHEFSHILNGDMRLNMRLIGLLYGFVLIAIVGRILAADGTSVGTRQRRRPHLVALGFALMVAGYVGRFFGGLIKAAVSRQREFLADASAVQFTRNPEGIAGALKRIGGYHGGTLTYHPNSDELSHTFFAEGSVMGLISLFSTHPPLDERIRRIDPRWDGRYIEHTLSDSQQEPERPGPSKALAQAAGTAAVMSGFAGEAIASAPAMDAINADKVVGDIGNPDSSHIFHARKVIDAIPDELEKAVPETYSARAVVYLMLLDSDKIVRSRQIDHLEKSADMFVISRFRGLMDHVEEVTPRMRLPLISLALPALRQLSESQYTKFKENIDALVHEENKVGLSEWALQCVVTKHLGAACEGKHSEAGTATLVKLKAPITRVLSLLAYADRYSALPPETAFERGRAVLDLDIGLLPKKELNLSSLNGALEALANLRPLRKPKLLKACVATITAGDVVAPVEQELVRAISIMLDCPMPPIATGESG